MLTTRLSRESTPGGTPSGSTPQRRTTSGFPMPILAPREIRSGLRLRLGCGESPQREGRRWQRRILASPRLALLFRIATIAHRVAIRPGASGRRKRMCYRGDPAATFKEVPRPTRASPHLRHCRSSLSSAMPRPASLPRLRHQRVDKRKRKQLASQCPRSRCSIHGSLERDYVLKRRALARTPIALRLIRHTTLSRGRSHLAETPDPARRCPMLLTIFSYQFRPNHPWRLGPRVLRTSRARSHGALRPA